MLGKRITAVLLRQIVRINHPVELSALKPDKNLLIAYRNALIRPCQYEQTVYMLIIFIFFRPNPAFNNLNAYLTSGSQKG